MFYLLKLFPKQSRVVHPPIPLLPITLRKPVHQFVGPPIIKAVHADTPE